MLGEEVGGRLIATHRRWHVVGWVRVVETGAVRRGDLAIAQGYFPEDQVAASNMACAPLASAQKPQEETCRRGGSATASSGYTISRNTTYAIDPRKLQRCR